MRNPLVRFIQGHQHHQSAPLIPLEGGCSRHLCLSAAPREQEKEAAIHDALLTPARDLKRQAGSLRLNLEMDSCRTGCQTMYPL